jgi:serine/threonine-protein kinase
VGDRYDLIGRLGQGGMGTVYLAQDLVLGRRVALKVLSPKMASELFVAKFREEARIVASLDHPGIVRVYDAGQAGPFTFFVMEVVEGQDLATRVEAPSPPPLADRVRWIAETAEAMAYAHERGVVHRDLKPANVLVADATKAARVTDFGIAHTGSSEATATSFGRAGLQVGTPTYMAPEQLAHGAPASVRTDVYALGMTAWYALTGRLPFGEDPAKKLGAPVPSLRQACPEVSEVAAEVVEAALAPEPLRRVPSMRELAARMRAAPEIDRRPRRRKSDRVSAPET